MRFHHRLFGVFALLLAATFPGIREVAAAQPVCPCWEGGLANALNTLPADLADFDFCTPHPTNIQGNPRIIGAAVCNSFEVPGLGFLSCDQPVVPPVAVAFVRAGGRGAPDTQCNFGSEAISFGILTDFPISDAWACINDIAALCRSLPDVDN